jgi:hypothetical protein
MLIPGTPDQLYGLFLFRHNSTHTTDLAPIRFVVWANTQLSYVIKEIERRTEKHKIGKKVIGMVFDDSDFPEKELLKAVRWEARRRRRGGDLLKPYGREGQDRQDRSQEVLTACVAAQKQLLGTPRLIPEGDLYIPPLPRIAALSRERSPAFARINGIFASDDLLNLWKDVLPYVQGNAEQIPDKAYQAIRSEDDKWKAQKRTGKTVSVENFDLPEEAALADVILYRRFQRRRGSRGVMFMKALEQGYTVTEASKMAGISRPIGHKYKREIKQMLLSRKLAPK